jgi:putative membrane protein
MISKRWSKGLLATAAPVLWAGVLWAGGAAYAQQTPGGGGQQTSPNQQPMPGAQGNPQSPSTGLPEGNQGAQTAYGDQTFVLDVLEGDDAQVQMSQLATEKSASPDVKQFGQKMVEIHTQLNDQMKPAAQQLGVSEPKGPSKKERKEIEQLQALNGPDFDTAYIQAMARLQQHDLKEFENEARSGQTPNLQMAAKQDQPVLSEHYQVLEKLAQAHNVTLVSSK